MEKDYKLISEFLGKDHELNKCISAPQYKKCWYWLMPVVDKIEALEEDESWTISIELNSVIVWMHSPYVDSIRVVEASGDNKREATYRAVVEFIKYYNKTKTSISFEHENKSYTIDYTNELKNGDDWWHSYKVNGVMFDLHYCEDYNEIVVYLPNNNNKAIARKEIK